MVSKLWARQVCTQVNEHCMAGQSLFEPAAAIPAASLGLGAQYLIGDNQNDRRIVILRK